jgi:hypothetical protein
MGGLEIVGGLLFLVICLVGMKRSASDDGTPPPPDTRPVQWTVGYTDNFGNRQSEPYRVDWVKIAIILGVMLAGGVALMGGG